MKQFSNKAWSLSLVSTFAVALTAHACGDGAATISVLPGFAVKWLFPRLIRFDSEVSYPAFRSEFDSLADVVSFCVAPAFMLYAFALNGLGRAAWLGAVLFVICGALRLARFNVYSGVSDRRYFVGLPTPAAAGIMASAVLLLGNEEIGRWQGTAIAAGTYAVAILMVSTFRYYSFKEIDFARRRPTGVLLLVVLAVLIVATHPQWFLFLLFGAYVLSGPTRPLWARRREAAPAAERGARTGGP